MGKLTRFVLRKLAESGLQFTGKEKEKIVRAAHRDMRDGGKGAMLQGIKLALDCKRLE